MTAALGAAPTLLLLGEPRLDPDLFYSLAILEYRRMVGPFVFLECLQLIAGIFFALEAKLHSLLSRTTLDLAFAAKYRHYLAFASITLDI